jgi:molybdenum cofactor guanylyltransferase
VTAGVILAGGLARRMGGGDKCLQILDGRPLLAHVIDRIRPQVTRLALNANGDPARFVRWDLPVLSDPVRDTPGPLAGILASLRWAQDRLLVVPGDAPFLPVDLAQRLSHVFDTERAEVVMAMRGNAHQPVISLWAAHLAPALEHALAADQRGVAAFIRTRKWAAEPFDDVAGEPFFNVNTPDDLTAAAK